VRERTGLASSFDKLRMRFWEAEPFGELRKTTLMVSLSNHEANAPT
jgi:hypothetical protein